jgi:hypothetical protein
MHHTVCFGAIHPYIHPPIHQGYSFVYVLVQSRVRSWHISTRLSQKSIPGDDGNLSVENLARRAMFLAKVPAFIYS